MKISCESSAVVWQPITPGGVASFASTKVGRLWLVQSVVAFVVALVVVWFLHGRWFPTVLTAVEQLPPAGEIRGGQLLWRGPAKTLLAGGGYLAIEVNLEDTAPMDRTADVNWVFGVSAVRIYSLLGYREFAYPKGWVIAFNRRELKPWLGAWEPVLLAGVSIGVWLCLMAAWQVMATLYALPVRLVGFYANRGLDLGGCWRLAGAALMPAALFNAAAIVAYGFEMIDLLRLLVATVMHFMVGWVYLIVSPLLVQRAGKSRGKANPFSKQDSGSGNEKSVNVFSA